MNVAKRDRQTIILGGAVLAVILIAHYVALPALAHWRQVRADIVSADRQIQKLVKRNKHLDALHARLRITHGKAIDRELRKEQDMLLEFQKTVQEVLKAGPIKASKISVQTTRPVKEIPGAAMMKAHISGKCQIEQLAKFLAAVRKADTLVLIDRLSINPNASKPAELSIDLALSTLVLREPRP